MSIRNIQSLRKNRKAFTLIELLVVVLILSILMAVALPLYLSAVSDSQRKTCRANMQTIANAASATRVRLNVANFPTGYTGLVTTTNFPDLQAVPTCPSAGKYTILTGSLAGSFKVSCDAAAAHGTFEPGVDSN